jgi:hypothetical protein
MNVANRVALRDALTFHASFDKGPDADFALGDPCLYNAEFPLYAHLEVEPELVSGLGTPPLAIMPGKFGSALAFTKENSRVVCYRAEKNVAYSPEAFRGSASFWLSLDPTAIPLTPPDFRLGVFGDQSVWNPKNLHNFSEEFFFRLLRVTEPPFAVGAWTHVVITWDGINSTQTGRAVLFLNGVRQGKTAAIRERFNWNISSATIRLGTGPYVGLLDDLALFNRSLTEKEVNALVVAEGGISDLFG